METSYKNLVKENQDWKADGQMQQSADGSLTQHDEPLQITEMPDSIFIHIFSYLPFSSIGSVAQVCYKWWQISTDELLWKEIFLRHYKLSLETKMPVKAQSWRSEFKRLYYHTPCLLSEERKEHRDEVLHVSFSHDGTMFATCSKDGFFKVWECGQPCRLLFQKDMMSSFSWKFTQFSQFNETDTCLMVSGVYFGSLSTAGEIAVFNLLDDFTMQCRVTNKPYDVFGAWYDNDHLLSGTLYWTGDVSSVSAVWLSKASQEVESEMESVSMVLYQFENHNSSSIRLLQVAEIERDDGDNNDNERRPMELSPSPVERSDGEKMASSARGGRPNQGSCSWHLDGISSAGRNSADFGESLLDKLLKKNIAENEFDLENEDDTDDERERHGRKIVQGQTEHLKPISQPLRVDVGCHDNVESIYQPFKRSEPDNIDSSDFNVSNCSALWDSPTPHFSENHENFGGDCYIAAGHPCGIDIEPVFGERDRSGYHSNFNAFNSSSNLEFMSFQSNVLTDDDGDSHASNKFLDFDNVSSNPGSAMNLVESDKFNVLGNECESEKAQFADLTKGNICTFDDSLQTNNNVPIKERNTCNHKSSEWQNFQVCDREMNHEKKCTELSKDCQRIMKDIFSEGRQHIRKFVSGRDNFGFLDDTNLANTCDTSSQHYGTYQHFPKHNNVKTAGICHNQSLGIADVEALADASTDSSYKLMDNAATQTEESASMASSNMSMAHMSHSSSLSREVAKNASEKLLIYTWGSETYIPHKIGIKRIKRSDFCKGEVKARQSAMLLPDVMENLHNMSEDRRDVPDVSIDMHGHIVGLSLSPDQRYLYVNCRAWPRNYIISDPQESPPLAQEVEIYTIDLTTFQFVGPVLRSHKAYTHSDECFFLNLDVSEDYVVSGAEDRKGYLWDRHYGICLDQFEHRSVVNCMSICPTDPEVAVSVSDDHTFKVWMSRRKMKEAEKRGRPVNRQTHRNSFVFSGCG